MTKKNITYLILAAAAIYGGVYFYKRWKRQKANESVVSQAEADKIIDSLKEE